MDVFGSTAADTPLQRLLDELFEDGGSRPGPPAPAPTPTPRVPGLALLKGFLSAAQQAFVMEAIMNHGWLKDGSSNQAMCFGDLPPWALELSALVPNTLLSSQVASRIPLFDQLVVNLYPPSTGIRAHVDLMSFEDGIAIISLGSPAKMDFVHTTEGTCEQVLLEPGDLLLLCGDARYKWEHGIKPVSITAPRVSVTLRKLVKGMVLNVPA